MRVVMWRRAQLAYALIGEPGGVDLAALGKQVAEGNAQALYGSANEDGLYARLSPSPENAS